MFLGHYAVGLAAKKVAPRASLGALIAAPILLDLIWPIFLLLGWEHVTIEPNKNPFLRLAFDFYPVSHGLVAVVGWATLFASLYFGFTRYVVGAIAIWAGVVSHWLLDLIVHRPDLPLYSGSRVFGFGLWNYRAVTIGIELALLGLGIFLYLRQTIAKDRIGNYGFWAFILFLLAAFGAATFGPPPRSVKMLAITTLLTWLFIPWAWWFDRHREARAVVPQSSVEQPSAKKAIRAGG
jgi:hypothetical protein